MTSLEEAGDSGGEDQSVILRQKTLKYRHRSVLFNWQTSPSAKKRITIIVKPLAATTVKSSLHDF